MDEARYVNPFGEDFPYNFQRDFKIILFGSFINKAECYGFRILYDLYQICKNFNFPIFELLLKFKSN
jgi:hypothetical protein